MFSPERERITGVAILDGSRRLWSLPAPHRHHHIFALAAFTNTTAEKGLQGFTTNYGRFVSRVEAMTIARACEGPWRISEPTGRELFSERLVVTEAERKKRIGDASAYLETGGLGEVIGLAGASMEAGFEKVAMDADMAVALCILAAEALNRRRAH